MIKRLITIFAFLLVAGCGSNPMQLASNQSITEADTTKANLVFMRSSFVGSAIKATLYDVTEKGDPKFIGIIANGTKLTYQSKPGKRVFMVVSEAADFMEAELVAGKTYYSLVTPRMGAWKARFSLWPIKTDTAAEYNTSMPKFKDWVNNTKLMENTEKSLAWFENNKSSVISKQEKHWATWQGKSAEDLAKRTLTPSDGI